MRFIQLRQSNKMAAIVGTPMDQLRNQIATLLLTQDKLAYLGTVGTKEFLETTKMTPEMAIALPPFVFDPIVDGLVKKEEEKQVPQRVQYQSILNQLNAKQGATKKTTSSESLFAKPGLFPNSHFDACTSIEKKDVPQRTLVYVNGGNKYQLNKGGDCVYLQFMVLAQTAFARCEEEADHEIKAPIFNGPSFVSVETTGG